MSIAKQVRLRVHITANSRCGYCQTQERVSGIPLTIEHLIPVSLGGSNLEINLWLSCRLCNEAKGVQIDTIDFETDIIVPLYNPRTQRCIRHTKINLY